MSKKFRINYMDSKTGAISAVDPAFYEDEDQAKLDGEILYMLDEFRSPDLRNLKVESFFYI